MPKPKIVFDLNKPAHVVLQFPEGKPVTSKFEGDQIYFSVVDAAGEEMAMYVPAMVGPKIAALGLHKGDAIEITKAQTGIGSRKQVEWQVRRAIAAPAAAPEAWERDAAAELAKGAVTRPLAAPAAAAPNGQVSSNGHGPRGGIAATANHTAPVPPPVLSMADALRMALDAVMEAEAYGLRVSRPTTWDKDDVRLLATTVYISANQARRSW